MPRRTDPRTRKAIERRLKAGWSYQQIARKYDVSPSTAARVADELGMTRPRNLEDKERNRTLARRYRAGGVTMEQLGREYGLTRERVRQLVRREGVTSEERGFEQRQRDKEARRQRLAVERERARDARCRKRWDIGIDEYRKLRAMAVDFRHTPMGAYLRQRRNAHRRGISWSMTFGVWWEIWKHSRRWSQRGKHGDGYVLARKDPSCGFKPDNVAVMKLRASSTAYQEWNHGRRVIEEVA